MQISITARNAKLMTSEAGNQLKWTAEIVKWIRAVRYWRETKRKEG